MINASLQVITVVAGILASDYLRDRLMPSYIRRRARIVMLAAAVAFVLEIFAMRYS